MTELERLKKENAEMDYILRMLRLQYNCTSNSSILNLVIGTKKLLNEYHKKLMRNEQEYLRELSELKSTITKLEHKNLKAKKLKGI